MTTQIRRWIHSPGPRAGVRGAAPEPWARAASLWFWIGVTLALNSPPRAAAAGVVLNEVMYHPADDRDDLQYIEVLNPGTAAADLSGWRLRRGVTFTFPTNSTLSAGGCLVVCADPGAFRTNYGANLPVTGPFKGRLKHGGERLELEDARGRTVDALQYDDAAPWPAGADGRGGSLERICATAPSDEPLNWRASTPWATGRRGTPGATNELCTVRLPPRITDVDADAAKPGQAVEVRARVRDESEVEAVVLSWCTWPNSAEAWRETPMKRRTGDPKDGVWAGSLPAPPTNSLVRYVIGARPVSGPVRRCPDPNEPRSTFSFHTFQLTNTARIPLLQVLTCGRAEAPQRGSFRGPSQPRNANRPAAGPAVPATRWESAALYVPPGGPVTLLDHVRVVNRHGGFKVHFQKDQPLDRMTGINVLFEDAPRRVLGEHLAYELYRLAGVPAPQSGHVRVWLDGQPRGYQLLVEQPNTGFLRRIERPTDGNLYKLLWYGQGLEGQHEKKTNPRTGHADLHALVNGLKRGSPATRWSFIEQNFNAEEMASYYAVNMCIQNWDGFFNNYYAYHDPRPGGRWEVYPWDEDKTWGDYDGAWSRYSWVELPLTYGMDGDQPARSLFGGGPYGGASWWRPPGYFSGPLLANPEFRKRFLARLRTLCGTAFTPERMGAAVNGLAHRLEPEIRIRAELHGQNPDDAQREFRGDIESFHRQIKGRREFILRELDRGR